MAVVFVLVGVLFMMSIFFAGLLQGVVIGNLFTKNHAGLSVFSVSTDKKNHGTSIGQGL